MTDCEVCGAQLDTNGRCTNPLAHRQIAALYVPIEQRTSDPTDWTRHLAMLEAHAKDHEWMGERGNRGDHEESADLLREVIAFLSRSETPVDVPVSEEEKIAALVARRVAETREAALDIPAPREVFRCAQCSKCYVAMPMVGCNCGGFNFTKVSVPAAVLQRAPDTTSEAEMLKLIDERDAAEDALSEAYMLVTGRSPEWSNLFGFRDALDEMDEKLSSDEDPVGFQLIHNDKPLATVYLTEDRAQRAVEEFSTNPQTRQSGPYTYRPVFASSGQRAPVPQNDD